MAVGHTPKGMVVSVKLHKVVTPFEFSDYADSDKINSGSEVLSALKSHRQIFSKTTDDVRCIIPYHAVDTYSYGIDPYDGEKPSDAFCVDRGSKGADSLVGSAIVGESTVGGE